MSRFDDDAIWRRCEVAWASWLQEAMYTVIPLGEAVGNTRGTNAPMAWVGGRRLRTPDLLTTKSGRSEYWEIKFRSRPQVDPLTGEREHWISYAAFRDYVAVGRDTRVWIMLYEAPTSRAPGRWLRADVLHLFDRGHRAVRYGDDGSEMSALVWPTSAMEVVPGPQFDISTAPLPLLPEEGQGEPITLEELEPLERTLRTPRDDPDRGARRSPRETATAAERVLSDDAVLGLDVLRRSLGLSTLPMYSVLRVGAQEVDINEVLALLHYGIRVFLITATKDCGDFDPLELEAFTDSRLLEWAVVPELGGHGTWVVDGQLPDPIPNHLQEVFNAADATGDFNWGQYRIVHAPTDADVLVTAGAGTGKTETMSERLIFLLATVDREGARPYHLRADEVVLTTFTREAAREMRARIARTLMLRQRLSRRCVLPALAWMMQLSSAHISTIHSYAKVVAESGGGALGLGPGFSVAAGTMELRSITYEVLSPHVHKLLTEHPSKEVPAVHLWQRHIEAIWQALENNGISLTPLHPGERSVSALDWGDAGGDDLKGTVVDVTRSTIEAVASRFSDISLENQSLRTGQLVAAAVAALRQSSEPPIRRTRYLFVDEFQDTDALQMDLMLEIKKRLGASMFVVGDPKQGIYRFRGAEGNAFAELRTRAEEQGLGELTECRLTRNFRSGRNLLESLHPHFTTWGTADLLAYEPADRLDAVPRHPDDSSPLATRTVDAREFAEAAAELVAEWRGDQPTATIAILCRRNWQAMAAQRKIVEGGGSCELLIGGSFFRTPAVRELRVLLEAVADPSDDAALLEVCETRWAAGLFDSHPPLGITDDAWGTAVSPMLHWRDRIATAHGAGQIHRSDLATLRRRVLALRGLLSRMPVLAWVMECARLFTPEDCSLPSPDDETARSRYGRCLDHALTLLDAHFLESPTSLERVLAWLRLQIATNDMEDEPFDADELQGRTTALTVHKAKGLEFDRVLIPNTWTQFSPPASVATQASVLRQHGGPPRLIWRWSGGESQQDRFSNVAVTDASLWAQESAETAREEARLLYVALTRARRQVTVFLGGRPTPEGAAPQTWGALLTSMGA